MPLINLWGKRRKRSRGPLDDSLWEWPTGDLMDIRSVLTSLEVKGISGSGKSSGSGRYVREKIVAHPRSTMTFIAQKPEEKEEIEEVYRRYRKRDKLIIIEEGGAAKCNFFDSQLKAGADSLAMTEMASILAEGLERGQGGGKSSDPFWPMMQGRVLWNTIEACRQGTGRVDPPDLMEFIVTAPTIDQPLSDPAFKQALENSFHYQTMSEASAKPKARIDAYNYDAFHKFWVKDYFKMDRKLQSSVLAGVYNMLHTATTGLPREMTASESNVFPSLIDHGYSFLINMPISQYGPSGRYVGGGWKYLIQKHILRRKWNPGGFFHLIMCDEFQESITEMDSRFLPQCRSHGGALFALTQTINSEYSAMGVDGKHKASQLLSNFGTHIYHLCDPDTATFASNLLGQYRETFTNYTPGEAESVSDTMFRSSSPGSFNMSESYQSVLQPRAFMTGLRNGGPANNYMVDAIVVRPGQPFLNGENWQKVAFTQR